MKCDAYNSHVQPHQPAGSHLQQTRLSTFLLPKQQQQQQQQQGSGGGMSSWQQPPSAQELAGVRTGDNSSLIDLVNAR